MPQLQAKLISGLKAFLRDDRAATAIEYAVLGATFGIVVAAAVIPLRDSPLWNVFGTISHKITELTSQ